MGKFQQNMLRTCQSHVDWSSGEVRLEMKYAGNPSITIIQTSFNMYAFEGNNCLCCCLDVVIVGPFLLLTLPFFIVDFPFAFCILHSFSLCLYHCCIVRQCLGTPYQCLIGPSYNYCCWALGDQRIPLFSTRDQSPSLSSCFFNHNMWASLQLLQLGNRRNIKKLFWYEWFFMMNNE